MVEAIFGRLRILILEYGCGGSKVVWASLIWSGGKMKYRKSAAECYFISKAVSLDMDSLASAFLLLYNSKICLFILIDEVWMVIIASFQFGLY